MKTLIGLLVALFGIAALAAQPVQVIRNNFATTNVSQSGYVQLANGTLLAQASYLDITNGNTTTDLSLSVGPIGSAGTILLIPASMSRLIPVNLASGARLSVISNSGLANSGTLIISILGGEQY